MDIGCYRTVFSGLARQIAYHEGERPGGEDRETDGLA